MMEEINEMNVFQAVLQSVTHGRRKDGDSDGNSSEVQLNNMADARRIAEKLKLFHEVFQILPIPLIGIDKKQKIILLNQAARTLSVGSSPMRIGNMAFEHLPDCITGRIAVSIRTHTSWTIKKCTLGGQCYRLDCLPFSEYLCGKGVLLVLNPV